MLGTHAWRSCLALTLPVAAVEAERAAFVSRGCLWRRVRPVPGRPGLGPASTGTSSGTSSGTCRDFGGAGGAWRGSGGAWWGFGAEIEPRSARRESEVREVREVRDAGRCRLDGLAGVVSGGGQPGVDVPQPRRGGPRVQSRILGLRPRRSIPRSCGSRSATIDRLITRSFSIYSGSLRRDCPRGAKSTSDLRLHPSFRDIDAYDPAARP